MFNQPFYEVIKPWLIVFCLYRKNKIHKVLGMIFFCKECPLCSWRLSRNSQIKRCCAEFVGGLYGDYDVDNWKKAMKVPWETFISRQKKKLSMILVNWKLRVTNQYKQLKDQYMNLLSRGQNPKHNNESTIKPSVPHTRA